MSKTFFAITGPGNAETTDKLVYMLSVTNENGGAKDVSDVSKIEGWLRGPDNYKCKVSHPQPGQYHLETQVSKHGTYKLDVKFNNQDLFTSPLETEVTGAIPQQSLQFVVEGDGLHNGRIGENNSFDIKVTTNNKTPCDIELGSLQANCIGNKTIPLKVTRQSLGKYEANFKVGEPGKYRIVIKYHTNDKWQEVIDQQVVFSDESFGGYIVKKPPENVRLNAPVSFEIQSVDVLGEKILTGGDQWQALATGPERVDNILITDYRDGSYKCEIKFSSRGTYNIQVVLRGEVEAKDSPMKFVVS